MHVCALIHYPEYRDRKTRRLKIIKDASCVDAKFTRGRGLTNSLNTRLTIREDANIMVALLVGRLLMTLATSLIANVSAILHHRVRRIAVLPQVSHNLLSS